MTEIEQKYHVSLWTLNVIYYTVAITLLEKEGRLRETNRGNVKPGWEIRLESRIEAIRKKLSYVHVLIECDKKQKYTKHQKNLKYKMEKTVWKSNNRKVNVLKCEIKTST